MAVDGLLEVAHLACGVVDPQGTILQAQAALQHRENMPRDARATARMTRPEDIRLELDLEPLEPGGRRFTVAFEPEAVPSRTT